MIAALRESLERVCAAYRHGSSLVFLFDYDGTLTPIVEHPRLAVLDNETKRLLADLADRPRVSLGILSGRQLDELRNLIGLSRLYLAGTGGLELDLRGTRIVHPRARRAAAMMMWIAVRLATTMTSYQGAWLENKRLGLTVHHRHLADSLLEPLRASVLEVTRHFAGQLRIVQGPKAWEITPAWGWTKGTAVRMILAHLGAGNPAIFYAGDEANDVEAMETVVTLGGITLGIGPHAPFGAEYRLPGPTALRAFLSKLDTSLENRKQRYIRSARERAESLKDGRINTCRN
jgi:trehalose 6-phosphate phosphatase